MNIDEIKARAKDAKNDVDGHDAENMTYHYYHDVTALIAEVERLQQQLNAAVEDLYEACRRSPCNNGICVKKNCTGNIIPCGFEWRGERSE